MYETIFICLESERLEPKPIPIVGTGDTLMVRIVGYGFCPPHCEIDHNHIGHYKNYNCEVEKCYHITIKEEG